MQEATAIGGLFGRLGTNKALGPRWVNVISHNVSLKSFCRSQRPHNFINLSFTVRLESMCRQNPEFLIQSCPTTFYGHFELELWETQ